jgi:flagellar biosynthesis/type III secretory pathway protein FliH
MISPAENREVQRMKAILYEEAFKFGFQQGFERGFRIGFEQGKRELILYLLRHLFKVTDEVQAALEAWPADRLNELAVALLSAKSLRELGLES